MIRMLMLLGVSFSPMIVTASIIDGQNKAAQGFNEPAARRSQNVEIAPAVEDAIAPSSPTVPTPDPVEPEPSFQLVIDSCGDQVGDANFRSAPEMVSQNSQSDPFIQSVIPHQMVVELTGQFSGEWMGVQWNGATGYIHRCWR